MKNSFLFPLLLVGLITSILVSLLGAPDSINARSSTLTFDGTPTAFVYLPNIGNMISDETPITTPTSTSTSTATPTSTSTPSPTPTRAIAYIESIYDGLGLGDGNSMVLSPDGEFLYITDGVDSISVFKRDIVSGALTFVEFQKNGARGVVGLYRPSAVAVSPDGNHLYVVGDGSLVVFSRAANTGKLHFVDVLRDGVDNVDGLDPGVAITVSPDGENVYVAGGDIHPLAAFRRDIQSGGLTFLGAYRDINSIYAITARSLVLSPDGRFVYVAVSSESSILQYARSPQSGALSFVATIQGPYYLFAVNSISVSHDGKHLYAVSSGDDALSVFVRDIQSGNLGFVEAERNGVNGVDGLDGPQAVSISPDGAQVFVTSLQDSAVSVFQRNPERGSLEFVEVLRNGTNEIENLDRPYAIASSPNSTHLYVATAQAVTFFSRNVISGTMDFVGSIKEGETGITGLNHPVAVAMSPNEDYVYVASFNAVSVFRRNANDGRLVFIGALKNGVGGVDGLNGANSIVVSPDGKNVYVASYNDNALVTFTRNAETGQIVFVGAIRDGFDGVDGLAYAMSVAISADGRHVYAAGYGDDAISIFARDASTGSLSYVGLVRDNTEDVDGLYRAESVAVSPDGKNLYVASSSESTIVAFTRNTDTGMLSFLDLHRDGFSGVDGLAGANSLVVTLDGSSVYVGGSAENAIVEFRRDISSGMLLFYAVYRDGIDGIDGLSTLSDIEVSQDGRYVFVASIGENSLSAFRRNSLEGGLAFADAVRDGEDNVDGLDWARSVIVSADARDVYVVGQFDNAISLFHNMME